MLAPGEVCLRLDYTLDQGLLDVRSRYDPLHFLKMSSEQELRMLYRQGQAYARLLCR